MTLNSLLLNAAVLAIAATPAVAESHFSTTSHLEQIVTEAKKTQLEAREVANLLKTKAPDYDRINVKMDLLKQHSGTVNNLIAEFEAAQPQLNPAQAAEFKRMKELGQLVSIVITNKSSLLASSERSRGVLRAKAEGIARRAELLQQSALRIRG